MARKWVPKRSRHQIRETGSRMRPARHVTRRRRLKMARASRRVNR